MPLNELCQYQKYSNTALDRKRRTGVVLEFKITPIDRSQYACLSPMIHLSMCVFHL